MSRITEALEDVLDEWGGTSDAVDVLMGWRTELDQAIATARKMRTAHAGARAVNCPECGALAGEPCYRLNAKNAQRTTPHGRRARLARDSVPA